MKKKAQSDARLEALRGAPLDSWIALSEDESKVVAHGATFEDVSGQLDKVGDETATILKTPAAWLPLAV